MHAMIRRKIFIACYGQLAQLVEHLTFNQGVAGSNPALPTILEFQHFIEIQEKRK